MGKKIVTNEDWVIEKLKAGVRQRDVAAELGVSRQWVALFAKRNGLSRPKAGRPSRYDLDRVEELLKADVPYCRIVEQLEYPSVTALRAAVGYRRRKTN